MALPLLAWLNHDRIVREEHLLTNGIGRIIPLVCVRGEDDISSCGLVSQEDRQNASYRM